MLLAEHGTTGAFIRNYIYLNGNPFALVDAAGNVSYVLNDQIGQPQKMVNASGAITWHRVSGVYGDTVSQPVGSTGANPQRFPGQQYDANTGLHYNYFRDYDPATGRYLESDPIGVAGGLNIYGYAGSNPVSKVDPAGLCLEDFCIGEGALALRFYCSRFPAQCVAAAAAVAGAVTSAVKSWTNDPAAQREYWDYKNAYSAPMPPDLDECGRWAEKLKREKDQIAARRAWDAKYMPGRHAEAISQGENAVRNIERKMKELGCKCQ